MNLVLEPFRRSLDRFLVQAPGFIAAFVFLLVGLLVARGLRSFVENTLQKAKLDEATARVGINEILARMGMGNSPSYVLGFFVYWVLLLWCFVAAGNAVNLPVVTELLERFLGFLPDLVAAILILFGAMVFGRFLSEVVANAAQANGIRGGVFLSKATYAVIVAFASLMALEHLGIRMALVSMSIQIVLASAGFGLALAFGLGGRDIARDFLKDLLKKR